MPERWRGRPWTRRSARSSRKSIASVATRVWARSSTATASRATSTSASSRATKRAAPPFLCNAQPPRAGAFGASLAGTTEGATPEPPAELAGVGGTGFSHPTQSPYFHALGRDRYARQEQIRAIEAHTKRRLICFVSNPYIEINRDIITVFADLLDDVDAGTDLDLLLNTPGGDIDAAEKLVIMCRSRCKSFRIIVPESA